MSDSQNRRISRRRPAGRAGVTVQKGTLGLGANLALGLIDASEDGLRVRLKAALAPGDEVSVMLTLPGVSKPIKLVADVRWCTSSGDGHDCGLRLRRRLTYAELLGLGG